MNYNTYPQQNYIQQQQQYRTQSWASAPIPQVRQVSSVEEVRACPIEFDGSIFYFPDIANKKIYTKFVNMDGTVAINMYELKDLTVANPSFDSSAFITRSEFEETINQLKAFISQQPVKEEQKPIEFQF